jgi:hypothetical protein
MPPVGRMLVLALPGWEVSKNNLQNNDPNQWNRKNNQHIRVLLG